MIKYIGGALLVATGWLLGKSLCSVYSDRIVVLERFYEFVTYCESEINYYKTDMDAIIEKIRTVSPSKYDKILFENDAKKTFIPKECQLVITTFPEKVRSMDSESLRGFLKETQNEVTRQKEKAKRDYEIKGKMMKKLLPIAAVGIFILTL